MYRADAVESSEAERTAITDFARSFKPRWQLPANQFSQWHYMALSRLNEADIYHYTSPVIILMNSRCFSATDIFLAAFKGMKNVTLMGTPSGGGSALVEERSLGNSPFTVRLGSMASFQATGELFDSKGVQPDVVIHPTPDYQIGKSDNVLSEAVRRIMLKN
jgi:C-terminal processing protease CtpA/Prc